MKRNSNRFRFEPPRLWIECPSIATCLIADKFLAFKTPLDKEYDDNIPAEKRFKPQHVIDECQKLNSTLKLVVDLTNSKRYYDPAEFTGKGVEHAKISCVGHLECPDDTQIERFIDLCSDTIERFPDSAIGVHCTHGFNRTGFMICAFLVEQLDFSLDAALRLFKEARHPGIYKQDYVDALLDRFGDEDCIVEPVQLPEWRGEDGVADEAGGPSRSKLFKHDGNKPKFPYDIPGVTAIDPSDCFNVYKKINELCNNEKYRGFLGCQPVSMDMQNIEKLRTTEYRVSWKADGTRYLCLIEERNKVYFIDRSNTVFHLPKLTFLSSRNPHQHLTATLLDGELITDKVEGQDVHRYLVYDIMSLMGRRVGEKLNFDQRLECIHTEIIKPRYTGMLMRLINKPDECLSVRRKDFWHISTVRKILDGRFAKEVRHEVDGLIFQPLYLPYTVGTCFEILKWKPPSLNSVDFELKVQTQKKPGEPLQPVGHLYTTGLDEPFSTIALNQELMALDGRIIECTWKDNEWKFMRERTDKNQPNSVQTAVAICHSIRRPVEKEYLFDYIAGCLGLESLPEPSCK